MVKSLSGALALALGLLGSGASAQQVWKCESGGQVRFSDKPCPGGGEPVPQRALQPNVADSLKPEAVRAALAPPPVASAAQQPAGNVCPADAEIRAMETRGSSTTMGDPERRFMQDEVRRALQCRAGQGRYTDADWAVSRAAQAAQTQIGDRARQDARLRAEAMHSAADPAEGDRIARQRAAEERLQQRARQRHLQPLMPPIPIRGQNAASTPSP